MESERTGDKQPMSRTQALQHSKQALDETKADEKVGELWDLMWEALLSLVRGVEQVEELMIEEVAQLNVESIRSIGTKIHVLSANGMARWNEEQFNALDNFQLICLTPAQAQVTAVRLSFERLLTWILRMDESTLQKQLKPLFRGLCHQEPQRLYNLGKALLSCGHFHLALYAFLQLFAEASDNDIKNIFNSITFEQIEALILADAALDPRENDHRRQQLEDELKQLRHKKEHDKRHGTGGVSLWVEMATLKKKWVKAEKQWRQLDTIIREIVMKLQALDRGLSPYAQKLLSQKYPHNGSELINIDVYMEKITTELKLMEHYMEEAKALKRIFFQLKEGVKNRMESDRLEVFSNVFGTYSVGQLSLALMRRLMDVGEETQVEKMVRLRHFKKFKDHFHLYGEMCKKAREIDQCLKENDPDFTQGEFVLQQSLVARLRKKIGAWETLKTQLTKLTGTDY